MNNPKDGLSKKSRGILFMLRKMLAAEGKTIHDQVQKVFEFHKEKFKKKEFAQLVKSLDTRLTFEEIDSLGDELDADGNGFIFLTELARSMDMLTVDDDPYSSILDVQSKEIMTKSKLGRISVEDQSILALKIFKDSMREIDPYQLFDIFDEDRDGNLALDELQVLMMNLGLNDQKNNKLVVDKIFNNRRKVPFADIMKALNL